VVVAESGGVVKLLPDDGNAAPPEGTSYQRKTQLTAGVAESKAVCDLQMVGAELDVGAAGTALTMTFTAARGLL
jgi:hypothetical protein